MVFARGVGGGGRSAHDLLVYLPSERMDRLWVNARMLVVIVYGGGGDVVEGEGGGG